MLKKIAVKIAAILVIVIIVISPVLLFVDFKKYSAFVLMVWLLSAVYYVFVKDKN